jgi:triacylglycerol lipase
MFLELLARVLMVGDAPPVAPNAVLPPVVVVHGIYNTGGDMIRLTRALKAAGREVLPITLRPATGRAPLEDLSAQLERYVAEKAVRRPFDLLGFSMGGLVARHYLQRRGGLPQVRKFVTLSTPHHGTHWARFHWGAGTAQMRRGSAFLQDLNADADTLKQVEFISIWVPSDLLILPATSSVMPQARNIRLRSLLGHPACVLQKGAIRQVVEALK